MRRGVIAILFVSLLVSALPASADEVYPIVFPVAGDNHYSDTWGAARDTGRTHDGTDIMADKMVPIVAAADGTVGWMHNQQGGKCCAMELVHDDGYRSWYIHMNNDTPGTDDGQGWGFAPGIAPGVHVQAGQLIGYVGDSGNAENTASHLHFELHDSSNTPFNPYQSLRAALPPGSTRFECENPDSPGSADGDHLLLYRPSNGLYWYRNVDAAGCTLETIRDATFGTGWSTLEALDLDGDGQQELLFYRSTDGRYAFVDLNSDGTLGATRSKGFWSPGWTVVEPVRFEGDAADELMFYRQSDGRFAYYDLQTDGGIGTAVRVGHFGAGWSSAEPLDIDGDGVDEMFFYRKTDGRFAYYYLRSDGTIGYSVRKGYFGTGWDIIEPTDFDGDGLDEMLFYRASDGRYAIYNLTLGGHIGGSVGVGYYASELSAVTSPSSG